MRKAILILSAFLLIPALIVAENDTNDKKDATPWTIDASHSAINFSIRHFFTPVDGLFEEYDAEVYFDPANLEGSSISVTIPVTSINTRNERRDGHLQSEDFFNAETWPAMQFVSSEVVAGEGENAFIAKGELTIRDVTKPFELPFRLLGVMDHPFQENMLVAGIVSEFQLLRNDFGVGTGDWAATAVVGDEVDVRLNLELTTSK